MTEVGRRSSTIDGVLRDRAASHPDRVCLRAVRDGTNVTYRELDERVAATARHLRSRGCAAGDTIGLGLGNTVEFFVALFGCFRAGLIAAPLDTQLSRRELQAFVDAVGPRMVVSDGPGSDAFRGVTGVEVAPPASGDDDRADQAEHVVGPDDGALLLQTSGTTGEPKGVQYSHATLLRKVRSIDRWFGFGAGHTSMCALPTHFGHGLICNCLPVWSYGGTLVLNEPFDHDVVKTIWRVVDEFRVESFSSVPTMVRLLAERAARRGLTTPATLQFVTCASAPIAAHEIREFERLAHVPLLNCYGLTETCGWSACSPRSDGRELESVGMPLDCEIRAVGDDGVELGPARIGELQIRYPAGYRATYHHAVRDRELTTADGWFATGDIGEVDERGAVVLRGRSKDLIIRAGKNVYPAEVEAALRPHPEISDICVIGAPDPTLGELVVAVVVPRGGADLDVRAVGEFGRGRLAPYKCPDRVVVVDEMPRTSRGKVVRERVRRLVPDLVGGRA